VAGTAGVTHRLLIVEDDSALNQMVAMHFEDQGLEAESVLTCADAIAAVKRHAPDVALMDMQLPDGTGLELLETLQTIQPGLPVVIMTGQHDLELAIEAIKAGAVDYLHKPVKTEALQETVFKALKLTTAAPPPATPDADVVRKELIGRSAAMLEVSKAIALSAETAANVLITGESGTGKEIVARLIHQYSNRRGPFVAVNCAAIVATLLESELFGHEKGAFTGADARRIGHFEAARDGTLFLDEVGELALPLQAKLLRVLQERCVQRVGGTDAIETNARVITATNRDLEREVAEGRFREDLLYRLNVVTIHIPALRDRAEDIPMLAEALIRKIAGQIEKPALPLSSEALQRLGDHSWPGNVRQLENVLTRTLVRARGTEITADLLELPASVPGSGKKVAPPGEPDLRTLDEVEAAHIQGVLLHTRGHKGRTCEILGISRPALDRKIEKYRLKVKDS
jgi:DNA-binding NtrC family response regulator